MREPAPPEPQGAVPLRYLTLSLAASVACAIAPAHAADPYQGWEPVGPWLLKAERGYCALQRPVEKVPLVYVQTAASRSGIVAYLTIMPLKVPKALTPVRLALDGKPFAGPAAPEARHGALSMPLDPPALSSIAASKSLDVLGADARPILRLRLDGAREAVTRLAACSSAATGEHIPIVPPPAPPGDVGTSEPGDFVQPSALSYKDYPLAALRAGEQGTAGFRVDIGTDGLVTRCTIIESSGSATLDEATCRLASARMVFRPARDAQGRAVADTFTSSIVWRLPPARASKRRTP